MLTERSTMHQSAADHSTAKKIDTTTWGLLLLMTGITRLRVSTFIVALGLLAIAAGASAIAGVDLPLFAVFLVLLGASIMLRSWFIQSET